MIIDNIDNHWRVTFASGLGVTPRVEVFHQERKPAMSIANSLEIHAQAKFPKDFPQKEDSTRQKVTEGLLGALGITLITSQLLAGAAAVASL